MCYKDVKEGIQIKEVQEINQLEEIKLLKQDKEGKISMWSTLNRAKM